MIRMSPDGRTVLLAVQADLIFYSAITGEKLNVINDIYGGMKKLLMWLWIFTLCTHSHTNLPSHTLKV